MWLNLDPKLIRDNKKSLLLIWWVKVNKSYPEALCGHTFLLTHMGFFFRLWWNAQRSLSKGSINSCQALLAVAGLSVKPVTVGVHPAEVFMGAHLALSRCVCSNPAGNACLLDPKPNASELHMPTCCSAETLAFGSPAAAGQLCRAKWCGLVRRCAYCSFPLRLSFLGICKHKNREEEKLGN